VLFCIPQVDAAIDEEEMREMFRVSDLSGRGTIDYEEFIAAMLDSNKVALQVKAMRSSFEQLDRDGDGFISVEDLASVRWWLLGSARYVEEAVMW